MIGERKCAECESRPSADDDAQRAELDAIFDLVRWFDARRMKLKASAERCEENAKLAEMGLKPGPNAALLHPPEYWRHIGAHRQLDLARFDAEILPTARRAGNTLAKLRARLDEFGTPLNEREREQIFIACDRLYRFSKADPRGAALAEDVWDPVCGSTMSDKDAARDDPARLLGEATDALQLALEARGIAKTRDEVRALIRSGMAPAARQAAFEAAAATSPDLDGSGPMREVEVFVANVLGCERSRIYAIKRSFGPTG